MDRYPDRRLATQCDPPLALVVDRQRRRLQHLVRAVSPLVRGRARPTRHASPMCIDWLPRLAEMGFDVLYLPPIHPIGTTFRKGKNNARGRRAGRRRLALGDRLERGRPQGHPSRSWARWPTCSALVAAAERAGHRHRARHRVSMFARSSLRQASIPSGFASGPTARSNTPRIRPRSIRTSIPFDFETSDWQALWRELTDVVLYWCDQGIRIFRVDNPHTKPFAFWEFLIGEVKAQVSRDDFSFRGVHAAQGHVSPGQAGLHAVVHVFHLAQYEGRADRVLHRADANRACASSFGRTCGPTRPTSCPSICKPAAAAAFVARLVLAATLGANYGIYGPPFETLEHDRASRAARSISNSEKYQLRSWDFDRPENLGTA